MAYVRTAGMSTAARRARRRAVLVILGVLVGLLLVFVLASAAIREGWFGSGDGDAAGTTGSSAVAPAPGVTPGEVSVNVYNAGGATGAAGRAGEALRALGFSVATVANDPEGATIEGVAVIRHGPEGLEEAQLLQSNLPDGVELAEDGRAASSVDLVIGQTWQDLPGSEEG